MIDYPIIFNMSMGKLKNKGCGSMERSKGSFLGGGFGDTWAWPGADAAGPFLKFVAGIWNMMATEDYPSVFACTTSRRRHLRRVMVLCFYLNHDLPFRTVLRNRLDNEV
jgi:hypothetical protein